MSAKSLMAKARGPRILPGIRKLIESARQHVAVTADLTMVGLYWNIGRIITQDVQQNQQRADYGDQLIEVLGQQLSVEYGRGFSSRNLWEMKRFCMEFRILQTVSAEFETEKICQTPSNKSPAIRQAVPAKLTPGNILQTAPAEFEDRLLIDFRKHFTLGWSHYRLLLGQSDPQKRRFYFEQTAQQRWSVRELGRQIESALFERVALSRNTRKLVAMEKSKPAEIVQYDDVFKDPYVLDFLGLKGAYSEKDLEAAIIRNLEQFLSELGSDFCFVGRQYAMRIDDTDYFLDLLFFHRRLRCLVAIDLKLGTFTAADKGQMDLYLAWLKEHEWHEGENEPVGLILCSSKKRQHVELLLRHGPHKMRVSEYLTRLPAKRLFEERLRLYGRLLDRTENAGSAM